MFISQLNKLVLDFFANGDYVIITNNFGNVILHPNSHQDQLNTRDSFLPTLLLTDVEHSENDSAISDLNRRMIRREQGNLTTKSLFYLHNMTRGEETLLKTNYFFGPIPNTPFVFAIASRHKLGFPNMTSHRVRDIFDDPQNIKTFQSFILTLNKERFLKLKSRYNCSIEHFAQSKYYAKSEAEPRLFCPFENADSCEPNYCVTRHFQNMMYDLWKIYTPFNRQKLACVDDKGYVNSCFIITGN